MLKKINNRIRTKKGQSTLEYAILIVIIVGALLSIQAYIKRGVQGRLKQATDDIGDQFSPGNTNAKITTTTNSSVNQTFIDGASKSKLLDAEETSVTGSSNIINTQQEFWGSEE